MSLFQEDMNLNEDKKAPLREKDLNTKREMVIQYIFAASKTVSFSLINVVSYLITIALCISDQVAPEFTQYFLASVLSPHNQSKVMQVIAVEMITQLVLIYNLCVVM